MCLWSKHVDLSTPGDRKSTCCGKMRPLGLTYKDYDSNLFTNNTSGELMVVHQCLSCGRISPNRIAGEDNEYQLLSLIDNPPVVEDTVFKALNIRGITLLKPENREEVLIQLFGWNFEKSLI